MRVLLGIVLIFLFPSSVSASVLISEVAWMGGTTSANDEWIELYNTNSAAVVVDGWTITDTNALSITLSGTIAAGAYAVLERTDDDSAPGSASLIYSGSLPNTGTTLTLKDAAGTIIDQVVGGTDWQTIGGDNTSKATAQLVSGAWVTGDPTPGSTNSGDTTTAPESTPTTTNTSGGGSSNGIIARRTTTAPLVLTEQGNTLETNIVAPQVGYVRQPVSMTATTSGVSDRVDSLLTHTWNIGEGQTVTGQTIEHTYEYPGTYVVVLASEYKQYTAVVRHEITILPTTLLLGRTKVGDIQITSTAAYEQPLDGFRLMGSDTFVFPDHSRVAAEGTITIPIEQVGSVDTPLIALYDTTNTVVAAHQLPIAMPAVTAIPTQSIGYIPIIPPAVPEVPEQRTTSSTSFSFMTGAMAALTASTGTVVQPLPQTASVIEGVDAPGVPRSSYPYFGLIGLLALGVVGVLVRRVE